MCIPAVSFISLGDQANTYVTAEENTKLFLWLKMKTVIPRGAQTWQWEEEGAAREVHKKFVLLWDVRKGGVLSRIFKERETQKAEVKGLLRSGQNIYSFFLVMKQDCLWYLSLIGGNELYIIALHFFVKFDFRDDYSPPTFVL